MLSEADSCCNTALHFKTDGSRRVVYVRMSTEILPEVSVYFHVLFAAFVKCKTFANRC